MSEYVSHLNSHLMQQAPFTPLLAPKRLWEHLREFGKWDSRGWWCSFLGKCWWKRVWAVSLGRRGRDWKKVKLLCFLRDDLWQNDSVCMKLQISRQDIWQGKCSLKNNTTGIWIVIVRDMTPLSAMSSWVFLRKPHEILCFELWILKNPCCLNSVCTARTSLQ